MKKAKLVYMSMMTRVIVDEDATREQIIEASKQNFINKVQTDLHENTEDIEDDEECPYEIPLIEQHCEVEVEYTDTDGVTRTATIEHGDKSVADEDWWCGIDLNESEGIDKAFDFNTFGGLAFGDSPDEFRLNAYECTTKRDGCWCMDENIELKCKIIKITPIK